ncbi:hypothetical protein ACIA5A_06030 [Micromonospora sp. NPDC051300]|uniref:hypothetical protein n=1 Tax=Micromonospora sp. NPDC051300 TaxID=3364286 RepID=UPI0037BB2F50
MQPPTAPPRDGITQQQVVSLIQDSPALTVGRGIELVDLSLSVLDDLTLDFAGGRVERHSYNTLHGQAELSFSRPLDWGSAIVRPYMTLSDGTDTARFNLGAYYTSTPETQLGEEPPTWTATGYDILLILGDLVGESYAVAAGQPYLAAVEAILVDRGVQAYVIDQAAADRVLPSARTWALDDNATWLTIVNDLLGAVGYAGVWSDWDGRLRCGPYQNPRDRAPEWLYTVDDATSMLTSRRTLADDYFDAPNRWVAVRSNNVDGAAPVEGNGLWTYQNDVDGPTSVQARGRVITAPLLQLDVADQAALVAAARQQIDADRRRRTTVTVGTSPNPLHWHFDRLAVADPAMGSALLDVMCTSWVLPLDGADMSHDWSTI